MPLAIAEPSRQVWHERFLEPIAHERAASRFQVEDLLRHTHDLDEIPDSMLHQARPPRVVSRFHHHVTQPQRWPNGLLSR